jgi:rubredoxin
MKNKKTKYPDKDTHGNIRTRYAIICHGWEENDPNACGLVYLSRVEYERQMSNPNKTWECPICGLYPASFSDDNFDSFGGQQ